MLPYEPTPIQELNDGRADRAGIRILVKREDLNHGTVSGNKWWKLKYNLRAALDTRRTAILTFGGAYSNHIYATAAAAAACGLKSIGVIRGEERLNPTLSAVTGWGMSLQFVTRSQYRARTEDAFLRALEKQWSYPFIIPEGGSNLHALRGLQEFGTLLKEIPHDYLCVSVGTGGTLAGLATSGGRAEVIGFPASKDTSLRSTITELIKMTRCPSPSPWQLVTNYHFGGYARMDTTLRAFVHDFQGQHGILLDPVYTSKMMFGVFDLIVKGYFPRGSSVLVIHTGGLQGWGGRG